VIAWEALALSEEFARKVGDIKTADFLHTYVDSIYGELQNQVKRGRDYEGPLFPFSQEENGKVYHIRIKNGLSPIL